VRSPDDRTVQPLRVLTSCGLVCDEPIKNIPRSSFFVALFDRLERVTATESENRIERDDDCESPESDEPMPRFPRERIGCPTLLRQGRSMTVGKLAPPGIATVCRKPVTLRAEDLTRREKWPAFGDSLCVIEADAYGLRLADWTAGRSEQIQELATRHGAVLLRGFSSTDVQDFEKGVENLCGAALEYRFRASPRTEVGRNIYTATDYPADQKIFPHNEHAYSPFCPTYLVFYCEAPATTGGETPIGDNRRITRAIDPAVKEEFLRRGVLYVRNYGDGFGLPWQTAFQTDDRGEVERYCASIGVQTKWVSERRLRTRQAGPAMIRHPRTGEEIWFNHATFFHVTTLPQVVRRSLQAEFGEHELPTQTYYGDGAPIDASTLEHLRDVYRDAMRSFMWRARDVLFVDNILTVHAREPFSGPRRVFVAMGQAFRPRDWAISSRESS
jgi:alpha-ketoglutarate-dependent taurine dioxygenase